MRYHSVLSTILANIIPNPISEILAQKIMKTNVVMNIKLSVISISFLLHSTQL
jgi:hypothetical protein